ncbi:MAG TPA: alkaline phosphatase family protein [Allosphingosinicella sp.]
MLRIKAVAALLAFSSFAAAAAQPAPPRLVVAISVDQLSADVFEEYRPHFTGGLRRLSEGVLFPSGYQSHAATETCPGHATILTGVRPGRAGIIANTWFDPAAARDDKGIYCAEDERVAGSSTRDYTVSTYHLRVPALGDYMKRADPRSRVAVAAGKDRSAVMMGGFDVDQRWWWSGKAFAGEGKPAAAASAAAVNAVVARALAQPREPLTAPPLCATRSRPVPLAGGGKPVGDHRFARSAGDSRAFRGSPELDGATLALAAALRQEMRLGQGPAPDLLVIGLAATDYVGHTYGSGGGEMCLQLLSLDRDLGDFFARLDASGVDYAVVMTADHGGADIPERAGGARVDPQLLAKTMGAALGKRLGLAGPVLYGDGAFGDIYVDRALPAAQRKRVLSEAIATYKAHPQVAAVFTAAELAAAPAPSGSPETWPLLQRAKASFDPARSGDFVVLLKERVTPIADTSGGYVATHGSPWDYDRRVPILFWRKGMRPWEQTQAVETVDILPTLAPMVGVRLPAGSVDGRCLDIVEGPATNC